MGTYCADPSGGFRLQFPCALQFTGEGVGTCSRHNLYHTGYTENDKQHIVDSQGVACLPSLWSFILDLSTCVHMADSCIDLPTEDCKLSAYCICRFLVLEEHKGTAIGKHLKDQHNMSPNGIAQNFKILRKCQYKLDCLIFEMLFIKELKPTLNKQCDSIRAKLQYLFRSVSN